MEHIQNNMIHINIVYSYLIVLGIPSSDICILPATIVYTVFGFEMEKLKEYSDRLFTLSIVAVLTLLVIWTLQGIVKRRRDASISNTDKDS